MKRGMCGDEASKRGRDSDSERLRGLEINQQLELGGLLRAFYQESKLKTQRVADLITDILYSAGVRRIYGRGRGFCGRRGSPSDWRARRLCRELRSGQLAPDQRPV
jgi:hypothetical protein